MKTAYQYIRISDEDQSNFSLSGQSKIIEAFAEQRKIEVCKTYVDECSAKDFHRPQWKQLEMDLFKNKNKIDYLIVMKYDRLIRNATEGLAFIEKMEKEWNIKLLSVMENFFIDPESPYFFKMRADLLVTAEFERRVISDRTKFGIWSARTQGRFIGRAPFGYDNFQDEDAKPLIAVNPEKKVYIQQIFHDYLNGVAPVLILKNLQDQGFKLKGHDALQRILTNHLYAGLVVAPTYKETQTKVVKGIHEAIITEDVFWAAYYKYHESMKIQGPKVVDPNLPLRGVLQCKVCGNFHTGGQSKGRSAYYYYYKCNKCKGENYSAIKAHDEFTELLKKLSLKPSLIKKLHQESDSKLEKGLKERKALQGLVEAECKEIQSKLDGIESKYIHDKIDDKTYQKWSSVFLKEIREKKAKLGELNQDETKVRIRYNKYMPYLSDLNWIYNIADISHKHDLIKSIFWGGLTKEIQGYRTAYVNPIFGVSSASIRGLIDDEKKGKPAVLADSPFSTRSGNQGEPFYKFWLKDIERLCKVIDRVRRY